MTAPANASKPVGRLDSQAADPGLCSVPDGSMALTVPRKQWAAAKDWDAQKETISRLYRDRELDDLMAVMQQEHNFYSTARMYKTKIRAWGIGKRLRDEDVIAILHLQKQQLLLQERDASAVHNVAFWVRGYRVADDNIRRYLRRKPRLLAQFRAGRTPRPSALSAVHCTAPPPLPLPPLSPSPSHSCSSISASHSPDADAEAEALLLASRAYVRGALRTGRWRVASDGLCLPRGLGARDAAALGRSVQSHFYAAAASLARADYESAFRVLDVAFACAGRALRGEIPRVLSLVLNVARLLDRRGQHEVLRVFLRYLRVQGRRVFGEGHELVRVVEGLARVEVRAYVNVFERLFALLVDEADDMLGPGSNLSFELFWDSFSTLGVPLPLPEQVDMLTRQLAKVDLASRERPWVVRFERVLAWKVAQWKASTGDFKEAERALVAAEATLGLDDDNDYARHYQFSGTVFLDMGNLAAAEQCFLKAVKKSEQYGQDEDTTQFSLEKLAQIIEKRNRPEDAKSIREYARDRLQSIAAQVNWDWEEFARRTAEEHLSPLDEDSDGE